MRFVWKENKDTHRAEAGDKIYHIARSPGGTVWELFEVVQPDAHGKPRGMTQHYLTNAGSLALAKKIASDLHRGKIYLDDECVPRKVMNL
tara:strand:- start:987 stop:1256 length:270 start_codon:yes stop_codon:yes gene_type:complete